MDVREIHLSGEEVDLVSPLKHARGEAALSHPLHLRVSHGRAGQVVIVRVRVVRVRMRLGWGLGLGLQHPNQEGGRGSNPHHVTHKSLVAFGITRWARVIHIQAEGRVMFRFRVGDRPFIRV